MIFVTVGTQMPFDRLVEAVDSWADGCKDVVIAQVGATRRRFDNLETTPFLEPAEIKARISSCVRVVIAHAGMGTILSAMEARKPLLVLFRRLEYREVTSDHQMAIPPVVRAETDRYRLGRVGTRGTARSTLRGRGVTDDRACGPVAMLDAVCDFLR